jgi:hypothetical protein
LLNQPRVAFGLPRARFSINTIGFDWETMNAISEKLGLSPTMNDEGIISENFDISILGGFLTCHLHYSDQRSNISDDEEVHILNRYRDIKGHYLGSKETLRNKRGDLPVNRRGAPRPQPSLRAKRSSPD